MNKKTLQLEPMEKFLRKEKNLQRTTVFDNLKIHLTDRDRSHQNPFKYEKELKYHCHEIEIEYRLVTKIIFRDYRFQD